LHFQYFEQVEPRGLADALLVARGFVSGAPSCLALGDNILFGPDLTRLLRRLAALNRGAGVFGHYTAEPQRYGVVTLDAAGYPVAIDEKPAQPSSRWAVPGFYIFDGSACALAEGLTPSARGELEITDLNRIYLERGLLQVELLGRGTVWMDAGTPDALAEATELVRAVQRRQGLMIACLEEIAWRQGWIGVDELRAGAERHGSTEYGDYLRRLAEEAARGN
jgi:glucose-1-phosphate thymidylyltransferase